MFNSLILVALTGTIVEGDAASSASPTWYGDYAVARQIARETHKPVAVFVGKGDGGYHQVSKKEKLSKNLLKVLEDRYVCLYLDTSTKSGRTLARSFKLPKSGLVISDGTGARQAFYHKGDLSNRHLGKYLNRYADPDRQVTKTATHAKPVVRVAAATATAPGAFRSGGC